MGFISIRKSESKVVSFQISKLSIKCLAVFETNRNWCSISSLRSLRNNRCVLPRYITRSDCRSVLFWKLKKYFCTSNTKKFSKIKFIDLLINHHIIANHSIYYSCYQVKYQQNCLRQLVYLQFPVCFYTDMVFFSIMAIMKYILFVSYSKTDRKWNCVYLSFPT